MKLGMWILIIAMATLLFGSVALRIVGGLFGFLETLFTGLANILNFFGI